MVEGQRRRHQDQSATAESLPIQLVMVAISICRIPNHGVTQMCKVLPDLMTPARRGLGDRQRIARSLIGPDCIRYLDPPIAPIFSYAVNSAVPFFSIFDSIVDPAVVIEIPTDKRQILLFDFPRLQQCTHSAGRIRIQAEQQDSRCSPIKAVNGVYISAQLFAERGQHSNRVRRKLGRMDDQTTPLVYGNEVIVLKQNID